jgi:hypothetical protein
MGDAIGDETLAKNKAFIRCQGARHSTRWTAPARLALEACEPWPRQRPCSFHASHRPSRGSTRPIARAAAPDRRRR